MAQDKKCPKCQSPIVWSMNYFENGSSSIVRCSKNISASRVDWIPELEVFCDWEGFVVRKNGGLLFYDSKGRSLTELN